MIARRFEEQVRRYGSRPALRVAGTSSPQPADLVLLNGKIGSEAPSVG